MNSNILKIFGFTALAISGMMAGAVETTVESSTILGTKRVEYTTEKESATEKEFPAAVPWLKAVDKDMPVSELITTGLAEGDQIQVYDLEKKAYYSWQYGKNKDDKLEWIGAKLTDGEEVSPDPTTYTLKRGTAFWYKPSKNNENGAYTQVGLSGSAITTQINGAEGASLFKPVHNLLINPKYAEFNIKSISGAKQDDVIVLASDGTRYRFNGEWGQDIDKEVTQFGVTVKQRVFAAIGEDGVGNGKVPAGTAFWYLNAGKDKPTINW